MASDHARAMLETDLDRIVARMPAAAVPMRTHLIGESSIARVRRERSQLIALVDQLDLDLQGVKRDLLEFRRRWKEYQDWRERDGF